MAAYHLTLKVGSKGKAAPHFNYICATEKYAAKRGVVHIEHGNMPVWAAADPRLFWEASDEFERANGTAYRELEVALPRELPLQQQIDLAKQFAEEACGSSHAFSFAIHHTKASDGGMNPHVHLQFSERIQDGVERNATTFFKRANKANPEKGGCVKDRSWQATRRGNQKVAESSERLIDIRQQWEMMCNQALADYGVNARIDCRSYEDRGIELTPQPKIGTKSWNKYQRTGESNERFSRWEKIVRANQPIVFKMSRHQHQKLQQHQSDLFDDRNIISGELKKLRLQIPSIRSRDQVITELLGDTNIGRDCLNRLRAAKQEFNVAQHRHKEYLKIMDEPFTWANIRTKITCWLNHASRDGEALRLREASLPYKKAQQGARSLLRRAKESPAMHAKADSVIEGEREAYAYWQQNIDVLERRLSAIDSSLESTLDSLELLQNRYPDIDMPQLVQQPLNTEKHVSFRM